MTSFRQVDVQFVQFARAQDRQGITGWLGVGVGVPAAATTTTTTTTASGRRNNDEEEENHGRSPHSQEGSRSAAGMGCSSRSSRNRSCSRSYDDEDETVNDGDGMDRMDDNGEQQMAEVGGNHLVMLGGYVAPLTAQVTSKEVFEGVVVETDDGEEATEHVHSNEASGRCRSRRQRNLIWIISLAVVAVSLSAIFVSVVKTKKEEIRLSHNTSGKWTVPTKARPTMTPTSTPTSLRLFELITDLDERLQVPNAQALYDPTAPQHQAVLWMSEWDEYVPVNDNELLQRYAIVVFFFSTKQAPSMATNPTALQQQQQQQQQSVLQSTLNNPAWQDSCHFLDPQWHICDWNCHWTYYVRFYPDLIDPEHDTDEFMGVYCPPTANATNNSTSARTVTSLQVGTSHTRWVIGTS